MEARLLNPKVMEKMKFMDLFNAFHTLQFLGIDFEKVYLKEDVSQKVTICILKTLKEL